MIDLSNMDKVIRSVYLDVVTTCLNEKTSPFYKKIDKSSVNIVGKEVVAPVRFGINGGVACAAETAAVPPSGTPSLINFRAPLVNIYGNLEITDKLFRASEVGAGGAVDVLNYEIDSLLDSAKFNLRRMLFQNGDGTLCKMSAAGDGKQLVSVDNTRNVVEGMIVDFISSGSVVLTAKVTLVDKTNSQIKVDKTVASTVAKDTIITLTGSYKCELNGIPYIFNGGGSNLYGNSRSIVGFALPSEYTESAVNASTLQSVIDHMEENGGEQPDMIVGSYAMRRKYLDAMNTARLNVETVVEDGFKAPAYNGIPIYAEPFIADNEMFFLNTKDFMLAQLADWSWVEGSTHEILRPIYGKAAYAATLVKYCNLLCRRPKTQAKLTYSAE